MASKSEHPVRIGIIGCGAIAELYHLPALQAHSSTAKGIVLVEPNALRLEAMRTRFSAAVAIEDYHQLAGKVDGVIIATPPASHYPIAKWCLENGLHVLCEKPLTESIGEAKELVALARKHHVHLAVNQTRRLFPTYQKIRELVALGMLGELQSITYHDGVVFNWPAASPHHFQLGAKGAWSDTGVHLLDSVCYWLDAKPKLIESRNDSCGGPEAMATVWLRHQTCNIEIKVSRLGRLSNGFSIVGSRGAITAEAEDWDEITVLNNDGSKQRYKCASNRLTYLDFARPLIENFALVVAGKAVPLVSGESTLGTVELLEAAYQEAKPYSMPWNRNLTRSLPANTPRLLQTSRGTHPTEISTETPLTRVLVTGASGFLGARVVEAMLQTNFAKPVAALRQWSRAARVATHPVEIVICDIMDAQQVDATVGQVDAIVHCAYGETRESIVTGTRNLLEAAVKHGIDKFIYLSSAEAYGPELTGMVTEDTELHPTGRAYGDAKLEAEQLCCSYHAQGLRPTILRPSLIYGPFGISWSVDVAGRLLSGKWGLFDGFGDGIANLVYVDDLVQAIFLSLANPVAQGQTFNVNGPDRVTWNAYFELFNRELGLPPLEHISPTKSRLKTMVMDSIGHVTSFAKSRWEDKLMEIYLRGGWASDLMKRLKGALKSTPSAGELTNLYSRKANYDDAKIRHVLGYSPVYDLKSGISETIAWLELHELVPRKNRMTNGEGSAIRHEQRDQPSTAVVS